ncbi:MAG: SCP2 sterol-binding domain-containing protein [Rhodospirillales bacterium]|nr:SCP2 sterol-binding domain-containing protein [Rhodospirillales bacterium]
MLLSRPRPILPPHLAAALAPLILPMLPPAAIERGAALLLVRLARAEPRLIAALAALPPTRIAVRATELRATLVLAHGGGRPPTLTRALRGGPAPDATLAGTLGALIDLLEGRIDGDALFFSRALTVTGDSAAVVMLRNTLDRFEIDIAAAALGLLGPFAAPASRLAARLDRIARAGRARIEAFHRALHADAAETQAEPPSLAALRAEQRRLAARLARLERRAEENPAA